MSEVSIFFVILSEIYRLNSIFRALVQNSKLGKTLQSDFRAKNYNIQAPFPRCIDLRYCATAQ